MVSEQSIGDFLIDLSADQERLEAYHENAGQVLAGSGLSGRQQAILMTGDRLSLEETVDRELAARERPVPKPPRPIRRVGY
jgi:Cft2 family RNA processing exonuclease